MLEFKDSAGFVWYFNHLISFMVLTIITTWACKQTVTGHPDKFFHTLVSGILTVLFIIIFNGVHVAWWISPIVVLLIGIGKEVYDYFHPKKQTCDIKDFLADFLGVLAVTTVYFFSWVMYVEK